MPIQFTCPHCQKQTVVADQFGGQTGPCAACGAQVTIPQAAMHAMGPTSSTGSGGASVLFIILAVVGVGGLVCAGLLVALLLPAVQSGRGAARRMQSQNNLKQVGMALHNYHDTYNTFPPAVVTDANGQPLYSGRVLLLPFMEQNSLYEAFDKNKAWNSPENLAISEQMIPTFCDPASKSTVRNRSDYVFVTGAGTIFDGDKSINMAGITDGTSNTLMMIETATGPTNWAEPKEWNADTGTLPAGNHPRVVLVLYADGSVRAVQPQAVQGFLKQLTTRNDGQVIPQF